MSTADLARAFIGRCEADRRELILELRSYDMGATRLWRGRSQERLTDVTDNRVAAIHRELAWIDASIELVTAITKVLSDA